jgi:hypothetical protein
MSDVDTHKTTFFPSERETLMPFVNVGAFTGDPSNRTRIKSKAALKRLLVGDRNNKATPGEVLFDNTAMGVGPGDELYRGDDLPPTGTKLTVVGPDPHTDRKWYATVEVVAGKVTVK